MEWKTFLNEKLVAVVAIVSVTVLAGLGVVKGDAVLAAILGAAGVATAGVMGSKNGS